MIISEMIMTEDDQRVIAQSNDVSLTVIVFMITHS
jgi:hypothetical protein